MLTCGDEDIDGGMEGQGVDGGKMPVIMTNHFVHLQIPAFYQLVFASAAAGVGGNRMRAIVASTYAGSPVSNMHAIQ